MGTPSESDAHSLPAGEDEVQFTQLVKAKDIQSLETPPKIVPWTLDDFKEEASKNQQALFDAKNEWVQSQLTKELALEREKLKQAKFEQAYEEGYAKGFAVGKEEGVEMGKTQAYSEARDFLFPKLQSFETLLADFTEPYQQLEAHLLEELSQFAIHIAEKVILQSLHSSPDWLLRAIELSVKQLPEASTESAKAQKIEVFVSQQDFEFLQTLQAIKDEPICEWKFQMDPDLPAGSCRVKQGFSTIHNDWRQRFDKVAQQIINQTSSKAPSKSAKTMPSVESAEMQTKVPAEMPAQESQTAVDSALPKE